MASSLQCPRLVADIGATNARFALVDADGQPYAERLLAVADYPDIVAAINAYLQGVEPRPTQAALAVAMPILGDQVKMTNYERWSFSIEATRRTLGLEKLVLLNDFTALALSLPRLKPSELRQVGGGTAVAKETKGLISPSTKLGISGLFWVEDHWFPLKGSEGGHVTFSPVTELEWKIIRVLQKRFDHVSPDRLLSGPGLVNLYQALAELEGSTPEDLQPSMITKQALAGSCSLCRQTIEIFCAMLGTLAGDLALTLYTRGGMYIGGSIAVQLGDFFSHSMFRERFERNVRLKDYLSTIPTYIIITNNVVLRGLAVAFDNN